MYRYTDPTATPDALETTEQRACARRAKAREVLAVVRAHHQADEDRKSGLTTQGGRDGHVLSADTLAFAADSTFTNRRFRRARGDTRPVVPLPTGWPSADPTASPFASLPDGWPSA